MHELTWLPDIYSKFKRVPVIILFLKKTAYSFMLMWTDITAPSHTHCTSVYTVRTCCAAMNVLADWLRLRGALNVGWLPACSGLPHLILKPVLHDWSSAFVCNYTCNPCKEITQQNKSLVNWLISIGHLGSCLSQWCAVKFSMSFPNCLDCVWAPTIWPVLSSFVLECFFSSISRSEPILYGLYCMDYTNI